MAQRPHFGLPYILYLIEECHGPIDGVLPPGLGPDGHGCPVCDGIGPRPNVTSIVPIPHPVENPLGRLGRSLPTGIVHPRDCSVAAQGRRPVSFVMLSVPPVLLWRVA